MTEPTTEEKIMRGDASIDALSQFFEQRKKEAMLGDIHTTVSRTDALVFGEDRLPIRRGAVVISVDGETDDTKGQFKWQKVSYLGRYIALQLRDPYWIRVMFTTKDGYFYPRTNRPKEQPDIHPLAKKPFLVPAKGGMRLLDNGNILLVSRNGIFQQAQGWQEQRRLLEELSKEKQRSDYYMNKYEECSVQAETSQERMNDMYLRVMSVNEDVQRLHGHKTLLLHARGKLEGLIKNLEARVEHTEDVLEHSRDQLISEATSLRKVISDVTMMIDVKNIDDSMKSVMSEHPAFAKYFDKKIVDKWNREGLLSDVETEKLQRRLQEMEERIRKGEEEPHEDDGRHPPESPTGDKTSGDGTGSPTPTAETKQDIREVSGTARPGKLSQAKQKLKNTAGAIKDKIVGESEPEPDGETGDSETTEEPTSDDEPASRDES